MVYGQWSIIGSRLSFGLIAIPIPIAIGSSSSALSALLDPILGTRYSALTAA